MTEHADSLTGPQLLDRLDDPDGPVLVGCWDPRCASCRAAIELIDRLARRFGDRAVVGTLNVRAHADVARRIGIESVPTMVVFRDGEPKHVLVGADRIRAFFERVRGKILTGTPAED